MAVDPSVVINIAAEYTGKKAFKQAETATDKLSKTVKSLAKTFGLTFGTAAVLAYSKASVKAASEDIKAQRLLANTLKNVGLAYAAVDAEGFIAKMQSQTGVLDDFLRPAFAQLAGVTGSVAKTEKLLGLAFEISSGSTLDYASSVDLLAQAYVGNKKALKQLNLGYTQAELAAMSFDEIQQVITDRFAGSGKAALDTYIGQMNLLAVSTNNAKEIIGTSLLGAIDSLAGNDGIATLGTDIENAAKSLSNFIDSIVYLKEQIATIPGAGIVKGVFGFVSKVLGNFSPQMAAKLLKEIKGPQPFSQPMSLANQDTGRAALAASKKAEQEAIKRNKELAKLANAQAKSAIDQLKAKQLTLAIDKANLALSKGNDVFNMDAIQLNAALIGQAEALGKATTGAQILAIANDVQRLKVKQDINALEDAIASKDETAIVKATAKLNQDLAILGTLQKQDAKLLDINNVLAGMKSTDLINLANLQAALDLLAKFKFPTLTLPGIVMPGGTSNLNPNAGITFNPNQNKDRNYDQNVLDIAAGMSSSQNVAGINFNPNQNKDRNYTNNVINVSAGVIGDENIIVDAVQNALNEIARRGYLTTYAGALPA